MRRAWQPKNYQRKYTRRTNGPQVPLKPFQDWIESELATRPDDTSAVGWLAQRLGTTDRSLHRIRHGIACGKRDGAAFTFHVDTWGRYRIEDMLHRAGADFYDVYPGFAHERDVVLEPESWCPTCREVVTPMDGVCLWCDEVLTKPQLEDAA
jgi:hypothetical protein